MIKNKEKIIKGLSIIELSELCKNLGYSGYRGKQIFEWIYQHGELDAEKMNNLPIQLKKTIKNQYITSTLSINNVSISKSNQTRKYLFKTIDSMFLESVSMLEGKRHTICVSSQIGCNVDCKFCATGKMGLKRNLLTGEIIDQIILIKKEIIQPITNVVFMGMGEPLLNYDNVIKSANIINHNRGLNLGAKRITISTAGVLPQIKKYIKEKIKYKLAISLNASNDDSRNKIMPINNKWPIMDIISTSKEYTKLYKDKLTFEYVLIKNINDSELDAINLSNILRDIPCKINIIPYNEINCEFKRPDKENFDLFIKTLLTNQGKYRVLVRWSKGQGIGAGCGQLSNLELSND